MRKLLVVVDMQNDFIDGSLGTPEAQAIVENVKNKIREYDQADIYVTMDTHTPDYLNTQEGKNLPVVHCVRGTEGWQLREEIRELLPDAKIYEKPAFGSLELARIWQQFLRMRRQRLNWSASAPISASSPTRLSSKRQCLKSLFRWMLPAAQVLRRHLIRQRWKQ